MKTIAHISDLHFGREDPQVVEGLLFALRAIGPDVVAVSGDLTQRARRHEFARAKSFLAQVAVPKVVVPGNHDIPFYDFTRRFLRPLRRFKRYITTELEPSYEDEEVAILGLNTARSLTIKNGRLSLIQIAAIGSWSVRRRHRFKILVTHHSFIRPEANPRLPLVGRAPLALAALRKAGVRLLLSGHFHQGFSGDVRQHHRRFKGSILVAQAGTAVSKRMRGEPNAFNVITVRPPFVELTVHAWNGTAFAPSGTSRFVWEARTWRRLETDSTVDPRSPRRRTSRPGLTRVRARSKMS